MDQKLLDALSNLSDALVEIADSLKSKKDDGTSATTQALKGGNFTKQIKEINVGVKQLQKDAKKILKNQETIIALSKKASGDKKSEFEQAGGDKKKESQLKKGVTTILLIAVAVLAIGMAFKLVGSVNFLAVVGLGLAILLMSAAFEKIAKKNLSIKDAAIASLTMVMLSVALTLSSWILKKVTPIGFGQAITAILIAGVFAVISISIRKLMGAFDVSSWGGLARALVFLPLVLPAIAIGITISSWILRKVTPIGFGQAITAILIAGVFAVVSYGIKNLLRGFKGLDEADLTLAVIGLPLILPAIAVGIWLSSLVLSKVRPIGFFQAITSILIAAVFTVVSVGMKNIMKALKDADPAKAILIPLLLPAMATAIWLSSIPLSKVVPMTFTQFLVAFGISILFIVFAVALRVMSPILKDLKPKDVLLVPLLMTTMSIAVWLSSHILKKAADMDFAKMLQILVFSVVFAIAVLVIAAVSWVIAKYFGVQNVLKGAVALVGIATAIMASSLLLSMGKYSNYPGWKWSLMAGLSIVIFGAIAWVLMKIGSISTYIKGGIALLAVATTVMAASHILAVGNYENYPKLSWAMGVAASLAAFGVAAALLGPLVFGPQALVFLAGAAAVLGVAATIMAASHILAQGNYGRYPSLGWSTSVAISLAAFAAGMTVLGGIIVASFGIGALALAAGSEAVLGVAQTIVDSSHILAGGNWKKGPTVEWASGVAIALGAFSPIYKMLVDNAPGLFGGGGGIGPDEFSDAIVTVSQGIMTAANEFASPKNKGVWKNGPTKEWATGVGIAIGAFGPVYTMLLNDAVMKSIGKGGIGPKEFSAAILTVTRGIIVAAEEFAKNTAPFKEGMYPSKEWGQGVGGALSAFAPVFDTLNKDHGWFTSGEEALGQMINGVLSMAGAIVSVAKQFSDPEVKWDAYPGKDWATNVKNSIIGYMNISEEVMKAEVPYYTLSYLDDMVGRLTSTARIFGMNEKYFNAKINPNFMKQVSSNLFYYMAVANRLREQQNKGGLLGMVKNALTTDPIVQMARGMVELAKAYDKLSVSITKMGKAAATLNDKKISHLERLSRIRLPDWYWKGIDERRGFMSSISSAIGSLFTPSAPAAAPAVAEPSKRSQSTQAKGKHGTVLAQNDKIIDLLMALNEKIGQGSNLDAATIKYLTAKASARM